MYTVKIKYASGESDVTRCSETERVRLCSQPTGGCGKDGITDIIAWKDF